MLYTIIIGHILVANIDSCSNQTITFKHASMFAVDKTECKNETEKNFEKTIRIPEEIIRSDRKKTKKENKYIIDRSEDIKIKSVKRVVVSENNRYGINQNIKSKILFKRKFSIEDNLEKLKIKMENKEGLSSGTKHKEENRGLYHRRIFSKHNIIKYTACALSVLTIIMVLYFTFHS